MPRVDYSKVPVDYMEGAVERYVEQGISPGGFMTALLENDLMGAVNRADGCNADNLRAWVLFVYNELPTGCYGYKGAVDAYCKLIREKREAEVVDFDEGPE